MTNEMFCLKVRFINKQFLAKGYEPNMDAKGGLLSVDDFVHISISPIHFEKHIETLLVHNTDNSLPECFTALMAAFRAAIFDFEIGYLAWPWCLEILNFLKFFLEPGTVPFALNRDENPLKQFLAFVAFVSIGLSKNAYGKQVRVMECIKVVFSSKIVTSLIYPVKEPQLIDFSIFVLCHRTKISLLGETIPAGSDSNIVAWREGVDKTVQAQVEKILIGTAPLIVKESVDKITAVLVNIERNPCLLALFRLLEIFSNHSIDISDYGLGLNGQLFSIDVLKFDNENLGLSNLKFELNFSIEFTAISLGSSGRNFLTAQVSERLREAPAVFHVTCEVDVDSGKVLTGGCFVEVRKFSLRDAFQKAATFSSSPVRFGPSWLTKGSGRTVSSIFPSALQLVTLYLPAVLWRDYSNNNVCVNRFFILERKKPAKFNEMTAQALIDIKRNVQISGEHLMEHEHVSGKELSNALIQETLTKLFPGWSDLQQCSLEALAAQKFYCPAETVWLRLSGFIQQKYDLSLMIGGGSVGADMPYEVKKSPYGEFSLIVTYEIMKLHNVVTDDFYPQTATPYFTYRMEVKFPKSFAAPFGYDVIPTVTFHEKGKCFIPMFRKAFVELADAHPYEINELGKPGLFSTPVKPWARSGKKTA